MHTLRAIKSEGEISLMRKAGEIAAGAFKKVNNYIIKKYLIL